MQSLERHFQRSRELFRTDRGRPCPREWEDPQAKRGGGMERSGSLCGRVTDPREPLLGRQCCSIGKKMRMLLWSKGANSGSAGYDVECEEDDHAAILELELGEVLPYFTLTLYSGRSFSKYLAFLRISTTSSFGSAFITFPL